MMVTNYKLCNPQDHNLQFQRRKKFLSHAPGRSSTYANETQISQVPRKAINNATDEQDFFTKVLKRLQYCFWFTPETTVPSRSILILSPT